MFATLKLVILSVLGARPHADLALGNGRLVHVAGMAVGIDGEARHLQRAFLDQNDVSRHIADAGFADLHAAPFQGVRQPLAFAGLGHRSAVVAGSTLGLHSKAELLQGSLGLDDVSSGWGQCHGGADNGMAPGQSVSRLVRAAGSHLSCSVVAWRTAGFHAEAMHCERRLRVHHIPFWRSVFQGSADHGRAARQCERLPMLGARLNDHFAVPSGRTLGADVPACESPGGLVDNGKTLRGLGRAAFNLMAATESVWPPVCGAACDTGGPSVAGCTVDFDTEVGPGQGGYSDGIALLLCICGLCAGLRLAARHCEGEVMTTAGRDNRASHVVHGTCRGDIKAWPFQRLLCDHIALGSTLRRLGAKLGKAAMQGVGLVGFGTIRHTRSSCVVQSTFDVHIEAAHLKGLLLSNCVSLDVWRSGANRRLATGQVEDPVMLRTGCHHRRTLVKPGTFGGYRESRSLQRLHLGDVTDHIQRLETCLRGATREDILAKVVRAGSGRRCAHVLVCTFYGNIQRGHVQ
mmetsp:Transcript_82007/g.196605  ORF Transcript_82007/g.196605 Transcript_82007/m.196605 type:complete len:518 (-) Transcript_82007:1595-3148(-)